MNVPPTKPTTIQKDTTSWSFRVSPLSLALILLLLIVFAALSTRLERFEVQYKVTNEPAFWNSKSEQCRRIEQQLNGTLSGNSFWSQDGQDYYTYVKHFINMKRKGLYLDIAAGQPIYASTTYFYDHCLGWNGLCVEANPIHHDKFPGTRTCELIPTCVSSKHNQRVQFHDDDGGSGIIDDTYTNANRKGKITKMKCTTMYRILKARGITHVDYLSLDVEGHEVEVLKGFKLSEIQVDVITTELHTGDDGVRWRQMFKFMEDNGYVHFPVKEEDKNEAYPRLLSEDLVFVHRSVSFGNPK